MSLLKKILEGTEQYMGLLLSPAEGFGLQPRLFLPSRQKRAFVVVDVLPILGDFFCLASTLIMFRSNPKNSKDVKKIENLKRSKKSIFLNCFFSPFFFQITFFH